MNSNTTKYKRYAFISYSHQDEKEARWLHKHLEAYKLPNDIFNEYDEKNRYLQPVFRDKEDIKTGILKSELYKELESSKFLIVVCSTHSAHSSWVSQEVQTFIGLGRIDRIIPYIIEGIPHSNPQNECFPLSLIDHIKKNPNDEILGANIQEIGKEKALIRIISSLLDVEFDTLWGRHEREQRIRKTMLSFFIITLLCFTYWFVIPVSFNLQLSDEFHRLPKSKDAKVIIDGSTYPLNTLDTTIIVSNIPGWRRLSSINVEFTSTYYDTIHNSFKLGCSFTNSYHIGLRRDKTFAYFSGTILDENNTPIDSALIVIEGKKQFTDSSGHFSFSFPTSNQTTEKVVNLSKKGYTTFSRSEIPFVNSIYYLFHSK